MSLCRLEDGQESPGFRCGQVQTLTLAAGSSIACVIAFPALAPRDIIGLLGLGSVAISFAFQDIFKNFLAGILLLLHEQSTPEVDTSDLNDGSLHLIVRYWTLPQPQVRRTKTRAVVAIKVACVRAEIKIPQPVPVTLYSRTLDRE
jgi:small-conductance mechanosensitive channel